MTQKFRILLVEDDDAIREMYRLKFELAGINIHTTEDGVDGLIAALKLKPHVLLLDLKTPTIGGEEILEKLQHERWIKKTKIFILSNINRKEAPRKIHDLRFDRYIVKAHSTPGKVVAAVKEALGLK